MRSYEAEEAYNALLNRLSEFRRVEGSAETFGCTERVKIKTSNVQNEDVMPRWGRFSYSDGVVNQLFTNDPTELVRVHMREIESVLKEHVDAVCLVRSHKVFMDSDGIRIVTKLYFGNKDHMLDYFIKQASEPTEEAGRC